MYHPALDLLWDAFMAVAEPANATAAPRPTAQIKTFVVMTCLTDEVKVNTIAITRH